MEGILLFVGEMYGGDCDSGKDGLLLNENVEIDGEGGDSGREDEEGGIEGEDDDKDGMFDEFLWLFIFCIFLS